MVRILKCLLYLNSAIKRFVWHIVCSRHSRPPSSSQYEKRWRTLRRGMQGNAKFNVRMRMTISTAWQLKAESKSGVGLGEGGGDEGRRFDAGSRGVYTNKQVQNSSGLPDDYFSCREELLVVWTLYLRRWGEGSRAIVPSTHNPPSPSCPFHQETSRQQISWVLSTCNAWVCRKDIPCSLQC